MSLTHQPVQTHQTAKPRQAVVPFSRREQGRKLRTTFLRRFRACGEVKKAAEQAGIAHATLYRWRLRNEDFRARWDSVADQRRFALEDRMMQLACDGEKSAVFHKGEQVGWRVSHTVRAALAMLAYLDRREKARLEAEKRASESHFSGVSRGRNAQSAGLDRDDEDFDDDNDDNAYDDGGARDEEAREGGVGTEDAVDEEDDVDEVGEVGQFEAEDDEEEDDDEDEEETADVAPESVRPDVPPVAPTETGPIRVRIVHEPYFDNIQVHEPGAIVEIPNRRAFSSRSMEELKPGESVPTPARR